MGPLWVSQHRIAPSLGRPRPGAGVAWRTQRFKKCLCTWDGEKKRGSHILRYGFCVIRVLGVWNLFPYFFSDFPHWSDCMAFCQVCLVDNFRVTFLTAHCFPCVAPVVSVWWCGGVRTVACSQPSWLKTERCSLSFLFLPFVGGGRHSFSGRVGQQKAAEINRLMASSVAAGLPLRRWGLARSWPASSLVVVLWVLLVTLHFRFQVADSRTLLGVLKMNLFCFFFFHLELR